MTKHTKTSESNYAAPNDKKNLTDEQNPAYMFNLTHTDLLVKIASRELDARELALKQLRGRGLDSKGMWIGFDR